MSGVFICFFLLLLLSQSIDYKVVYRWMNMSKPVMHSLCLTATILNYRSKNTTKGNSFTCRQPKMCGTKTKSLSKQIEFFFYNLN